MSGIWSRDSTSLMDFEYNDKKGPIDPTSPFITAPSDPAKKRKLHMLVSEPAADAQGQALNSGPLFGQPGSHNTLESPVKRGFTTPNRLHLRDPNSQPFYFSENPKPLPAIPSHVHTPNQWAPRTPSSVVDSSGGETPNTPGLHEDSDAATPDTHIANKMASLLNGEGRRSPKKGRRDSWFKSVFSSSPSPSKDKSRTAFSKKGEARINKRRTKNRALVLRDEDDSDAEQLDHKNDAAQQHHQAQPGMAMGMASFFAWIEAHPNLPGVLSFYLQLIVNLFLGFAFMYILYTAWSGIMNDVDIESRKNEIGVMVEIAACAKQYNDNKCDPKTRIPHMETICGNWEQCMQRDPRKVARASVTAKTFAMIFNSFVDEFSYKSMIFTAIVIFGGFNLSNWAFGLIREKRNTSQHQDSFNYPPPPATPQRYPSGGFIDHQGFHAPYHTPYGSMNQNLIQQATQSMPALPSLEEKEARKSPSKKSSRPLFNLGR